MCLTFPIYYPATAVGTCGSRVAKWDEAYASFADNYVTKYATCV